MRGARRRSAQQRAAVAVVTAEIGAGAEGFALRGQNQRAAFRIGVERFKSGRELFDQCDVEKIMRRPPDLDQCHMAGLLYADIFEGSHANISRTVRRLAAAGGKWVGSIDPFGTE